MDSELAAPADEPRDSLRVNRGIGGESEDPPHEPPETSVDLDGKYYESFVVRLTLGDDDMVLRTSVLHVRSQRNQSWPGWEPNRILGLLMEDVVVPQPSSLDYEPAPPDYVPDYEPAPPDYVPAPEADGDQPALAEPGVTDLDSAGQDPLGPAGPDAPEPVRETVTGSVGPDSDSYQDAAQDAAAANDADTSSAAGDHDSVSTSSSQMARGAIDVQAFSVERVAAGRGTPKAAGVLLRFAFVVNWLDPGVVAPLTYQLTVFARAMERPTPMVRIASASGRIDAPDSTGESTARTETTVGISGEAGEVRRIEAALRLSDAVTGQPWGLLTLDAGVIVA